MQKVLILTYYWPPSGGAGVQRWLKFVKYMQNFNWEPIVYTAQNGEMPVIDNSLEKEIPKNIIVLKTKIWEPYSFYKAVIGRKKNDKINASFLSENKSPGFLEKVSVWIRGNFFIPDARKFWIKPSINYLSDYVQKNNVQFIISSGPPHSMHLIALGLKKKFPTVKWMADFRDPWTHIDFYDKLMLSSFADKQHHQMELEVLKNSDLVLSIGQQMQNEFIELYKKSDNPNFEKFKVLTNGFDQDDLQTASSDKDKKFSIAHIGTLVKDRNPQMLWRVLKKLVETNIEFKNRLEIKLVGKIDIAVKNDLEKFELNKYVNKIEYLPHNEVIVEQQKSHLLLLLVNNTKNAKGILTGKFFEYMASGSNILAIGPTDGDLAVIMNETKVGKIIDFEDEVELEKTILKFFNGEKENPLQEKIARYSRKNLTKELCEMLNQLRTQRI